MPVVSKLNPGVLVGCATTTTATVAIATASTASNLIICNQDIHVVSIRFQTKTRKSSKNSSNTTRHGRLRCTSNGHATVRRATQRVVWLSDLSPPRHTSPLEEEE